jgi:hypothetical protein
LKDRKSKDAYARGAVEEVQGVQAAEPARQAMAKQDN